jgi:hypothetical protein
MKKFWEVTKPGDVATPPKFCAPDQPRLDWQVRALHNDLVQHKSWVHVSRPLALFLWLFLPRSMAWQVGSMAAIHADFLCAAPSHLACIVSGYR